ncbi:MAG TPA: hypothetical protein VK742_20495 [Candidatus Sulfotelmatobacter sp.]|jgi:hypothetical protein|nr:hypothetical protein [Candidatus Sulfotelmatobacter sp.]
MADSSYKIQIIFDLINQGKIPEAKAELQQLAAGTATFTDKTDELGAAQKKTAGLVDEHNSKGRAQYLLFSEMNRICPKLGEAIHMVFAGPLAPLLILTGAIEYAHEQLKEFNEEMDKAAEKAAEGDFLPNIEDKLRVLGEAAAAAQAYADNISNAATNEDHLIKSLDNELSRLQAIERARAALDSAKKELAIAQIQQQEAAGQITPEQAAEQRAKVETDFIQDQEKKKEADQDAQVARFNANIKTLSDHQAELDTNKDSTAAAVTARKVHEGEVQIDPAVIAKQQAEAQKRLDAANTLVDQARSEADQYRAAKDYSLYDPHHQQELDQAQADAQADADKQKGAVNYFTYRQQQYDQANSPAAKAAAQAQDDAAKAALEAADKNRSEVKNTTEKRDQYTAENIGDPNDPDSPRNQARAIAGIQVQTKNTEENARIEKQFTADATAIHAFDVSKHSSPETIRKAAQNIADLQLILKDHADVVKNLADLDLPGIMKDVQSALAKLQRQNEANARGPQ